MEWLPHATEGYQQSQQVGGKSQENRIRGKLGVQEPHWGKQNWDTEDDLDGLIEQNPGIHPKLAADLPVVIPEEDNPCPIATVETKTLEPNDIAAAAETNSGIKHTPGVCDGNNAPTPFLNK